MGDQDKSSALKRLHKMAVNGETKGSPIDFLQDLIDQEWSHAENSGGKTFMGDVVKGRPENYGYPEPGSLREKS